LLGTLADLQAELGGHIIGDGSVVLVRVSAVDEATPDALTFATDESYYAAALSSGAGAILVDAQVPLDGGAPPPKPLLIVENARAALAVVLGKLKAARPKGPYRHATAIVEDGASIGEDAYLGPSCYVGANARIGARVALGHGAFVGAGATIGDDTYLHPSAIVHERCIVGERVVLHSGVIIGSEGFGWAFIEGRLERIPQVGNVVLDDDVEIGANSCVDRAQTGSTSIGRGTKIDNLVQIGHNCRIGMHCVIAALTGFAGSTTIGDYVKVAGQVGTRGHMRIGSRATVAGQSGVWGDVDEGATVSGNPARDHRERIRAKVMLRTLPKLIARVEALEKRAEKSAD
jgi:UDP-3-O-[3-hydroxymyristoyl] glucosamine N-acyltransferase